MNTLFCLNSSMAKSQILQNMWSAMKAYYSVIKWIGYAALAVMFANSSQFRTKRKLVYLRHQNHLSSTFSKILKTF